MVERPIKKSERQLKVDTDNSERQLKVDTDNSSENLDSMPSVESKPKISKRNNERSNERSSDKGKKSKNMDEVRQQVNPALARGPKPAKLKPKEVKAEPENDELQPTSEESQE